MSWGVLVPWVVSGLLGMLGPRLGRLLPPASAVRLLSLAAIVTALATGLVLALATFVVLAQLPDVAMLGGWSVTTVRAGSAVPASAGVLAGLAVTLLLVSALCRVVRAGSDLAVAARVCRRLGPGAAGLVIVEDEHPDAYALPGVRGRIIVSTAMLRALLPAERRVLLAHEAAHLTHRHHVYVQLTQLAAAANPLLRPVAGAVSVAVERWADEAAAAEVGDRRLAAVALARAGLARAAAVRSAGPLPAAALAAADRCVADRARALLAPPPPARRGLVLAVAAVVLAGPASAAHTARATERRFEMAEAAYASPVARPSAAAAAPVRAGARDLRQGSTPAPQRPPVTAGRLPRSR